MRYSTTSDCACQAFGSARAFAILREIGYEWCDYGTPYSIYDYHKKTIFNQPMSEFEAFFRQEHENAKAAGMHIGQVHAPFPTYPESGDPDECRDMIEAIKKSITASAIMESPYLVIHGAMPLGWRPDEDPAKTREINARIFDELIPVARQAGVKLALENMPCVGIPTCTPEMLCDYIDMMKAPDVMCACLDTGHANITGIDPGQFARKLGDRLQVLHIHDNDSKGDQHTLPFIGNVNWGRFFSALHDIGYAGTLSYEADHFQLLPPKEFYPLFETHLLNVLKKLVEVYYK